MSASSVAPQHERRARRSSGWRLRTSCARSTEAGAGPVDHAIGVVDRASRRRRSSADVDRAARPGAGACRDARCRRHRRRRRERRRWRRSPALRAPAAPGVRVFVITRTCRPGGSATFTSRGSALVEYDHAFELARVGLADDAPRPPGPACPGGRGSRRSPSPAARTRPGPARPPLAWSTGRLLGRGPGQRASEQLLEAPVVRRQALPAAARGSRARYPERPGGYAWSGSAANVARGRETAIPRLRAGRGRHRTPRSP